MPSLLSSCFYNVTDCFIIIIVIIIIRYLINQLSQLRRSENDQSSNIQFVGSIVLWLRCNQNDILDYLSSTVQLCKFP